MSVTSTVEAQISRTRPGLQVARSSPPQAAAAASTMSKAEVVGPRDRWPAALRAHRTTVGQRPRLESVCLVNGLRFLRLTLLQKAKALP